MRISKPLKFFLTVFLSLLISHIPHVAFAQAKMIPTSAVLADMTRAQALAKVDSFLQKEEVQKQLLAQGLTRDEVSQRLATLSDTELKQLAGQMSQAHYGGDILFTVLIVVLIIFLIRRL